MNYTQIGSYIKNIVIPTVRAETTSIWPTEGGSKSFAEMVAGIINILMVIVVVAAVIFIMMAGIQYISSQGDAQKAKTAMSSITNAIIGLVVAFAAYILVTLVLGKLVGTDTTVDGIVNITE